MYRLTDSLTQVLGIGAKTKVKLEQNNILCIKDLLLCLPINYQDFSNESDLTLAKQGDSITISGVVIQVKTIFKTKTLTTAKIQTDNNLINCIWFNNSYIGKQLKTNQSYRFSGKVGRNQSLIQPKFEQIENNKVRTGRIVPKYSSRLGITNHRLSKIVHHIINNLEPVSDFLHPYHQQQVLTTLTDLFRELHFPSNWHNLELAQQRLGLEEMIILIAQANRLKQNWHKQQVTKKFILLNKKRSLPFTLTIDQQLAIKTITQDLTNNKPMNRLLVGDVGTGKTIVAFITAQTVIEQDGKVALIAPTQVLAQQHQKNYRKIFNQEVPLITSKTQLKGNTLQAPMLIGTHAIINSIKILNRDYIIFDEQHKFGVRQRSLADLSATGGCRPHLLTMTATPIPRSLMLTIFANLDISIIRDNPFGEKKVQTWVVPADKQVSGWRWVIEQVNQTRQQALVICPFIDQSADKSLENVQASTQVFQEVFQMVQELKLTETVKIGLLHGQLSQTKKEQIIADLYKDKIQILVSTPMVEVGVDLPQASYLIIHSAERFGLASLHQLRGRIGRKGQKSYCLLFTSKNKKVKKPHLTNIQPIPITKQTMTKESIKNQRLDFFASHNDGHQLAEYDLKQRGAGDLFGITQHGFDQLKFASWADYQTIKQAREIYTQIKNNFDQQPWLLEIDDNQNNIGAN